MQGTHSCLFRVYKNKDPILAQIKFCDPVKSYCTCLKLIKINYNTKKINCHKKGSKMFKIKGGKHHIPLWNETRKRE